MAAYSPFDFGGDLGPLASTGRGQVLSGQSRSLDSDHYRKPTNRETFSVGPEYISPIVGHKQPMLGSGSSEIPAFDEKFMLEKFQKESIAHYQQLGYDLQSLMSMGPDDYLVFASDLSNPNDPIIPLLALTYTNADQSVVTVDIRDTQQKSSAFALRFRKVESTGWIIESSQESSQRPSSEVLPLESNSLSLTLATWMVFITQSLIVGKVNESRKVSRKKGPTIQEREGGCMDHDMVCTLGAAGDARRLGFPGVLSIDIFDCCVKHDLELWCARDDGGTANQNVIGCVRNKIIEAIAALPFPFNLVVWTALAPILLRLEILARLIAFFFNLSPDPPYLGGGAGWSCLCDGNEPTVSCNEPCRNLCEKFGRQQTCFKCGWSCQYDRGSGANQGRFIGVQFNSDPRGIPCCPETRPDPNKPNPCIANTAEEARASCDTCYSCRWECGNDSKGHQKRVLRTDPVNNLPCCRGTEIEPKGKWCVEDVKRGTKGVV